VKKLLGHKRIENRMKVLGLIDFKDDQFETTKAMTPEGNIKTGASRLG